MFESNVTSRVGSHDNAINSMMFALKQKRNCDKLNEYYALEPDGPRRVPVSSLTKKYEATVSPRYNQPKPVPKNLTQHSEKKNKTSKAAIIPALRCNENTKSAAINMHETKVKTKKQVKKRKKPTPTIPPTPEFALKLLEKLNRQADRRRRKPGIDKATPTLGDDDNGDHLDSHASCKPMVPSALQVVIDNDKVILSNGVHLNGTQTQSFIKSYHKRKKQDNQAMHELVDMYNVKQRKRLYLDNEVVYPEHYKYPVDEPLQNQRRDVASEQNEVIEESQELGFDSEQFGVYGNAFNVQELGGGNPKIDRGWMGGNGDYECLQEVDNEEISCPLVALELESDSDVSNASTMCGSEDVEIVDGDRNHDWERHVMIGGSKSTNSSLSAIARDNMCWKGHKSSPTFSRLPPSSPLSVPLPVRSTSPISSKPTDNRNCSIDSLDSTLDTDLLSPLQNCFRKHKPNSAQSATPQDSSASVTPVNPNTSASPGRTTAVNDTDVSQISKVSGHIPHSPKPDSRGLGMSHTRGNGTSVLSSTLGRRRSTMQYYYKDEHNNTLNLLKEKKDNLTKGIATETVQTTCGAMINTYTNETPSHARNTQSGSPKSLKVVDQAAVANTLSDAHRVLHAYYSPRIKEGSGAPNAQSVSSPTMNEDEDGASDFCYDSDEDNALVKQPIAYEQTMKTLMEDILQTQFYDKKRTLEDEIAELHTGFQRLDRDQDGFVSYNDLHSFCKEHFDIEKRIRHRNANVNRSNSVRKSSFRVQDSMVTRSAAEMAHGAYINPADYMDPSKPTGPKAAGKELDVDQKHLWKLLKGIIFILDDSRRNSLTFDDVSKYYLNYCKEKKEAEAMVLKNSIPPNGVPKNAFNKRKLRQSWDAERGTDANDWISSGDPVIDSDVVHRKLLYSSGGYGIKRGKCKQDMDKRIDSKLEEAYRNEHKKQPNLLFYLIFYAYLENDNISSFANKNEIGNGIVVDDEGEDAILDTVDCTIHSAELLLLPALYKLITVYGPSKADYMFEQLFGRTTANVQDTDFIYFSDYLNRIMRVDELIYTDYNNHIVSLTRIQKIEIYDKLYRKPRMARMRMLNKYNLSEGHGEKQKEESSSSKIKQDHDMENLDILNRLQRNSTDNGRGRTSSSVSINTTYNTNKNSAANQNPVPPSMATRPSRSAPSTRRPTFR